MSSSSSMTDMKMKPVMEVNSDHDDRDGGGGSGGGGGKPEKLNSSRIRKTIVARQMLQSLDVDPDIGIDVAVEDNKAELRKNNNDKAAPGPWTSMLETSFSSSTPRSIQQMHKVQMSFTGVTYAINGTHILENVTGNIEPGELVALMGSSGSGKTTLLDILAGRKTTGELEGGILMNGHVPDRAFKYLSSYVTQEDVLQPTMTCREFLEFVSHMRLPESHISPVDRESFINSTLEHLDMHSRADTRIGGTLPNGMHLSGLSGGQKRRLSLGGGLVTNPAIIFLDEPTSGLDATAAVRIVLLLRALAKEGRTVVLSIHQPRSSVFQMFDKVLLLSKGKQMFWGSPQECVTFFSTLYQRAKEDASSPGALSVVQMVDDLDLNVFNGLNPADAVMDMISALKGPAIDWVCQQSLHGGMDDAMPLKRVTSILQKQRFSAEAHTVGFWTRYKILQRRAFQIMLRNPGDALMRLATAVFLGLLFGFSWSGVGTNYSSIVQRLAFLHFIAISCSLLSFAHISLFYGFRRFFQRERKMKLYEPLEYYMATMLTEMIEVAVDAVVMISLAYWIGGLNPDMSRFGFSVLLTIITFWNGDVFLIGLSNALPTPDMTYAMGAGAVALFQLYAGFMITYTQMPAGLSWLHYFSWLKYSVQAFVLNDLEGLELVCDLPPPLSCESTGDEVIARWPFNTWPNGKWECVAVLCGIHVLFHIGSFVALKTLHREQR